MEFSLPTMEFSLSTTIGYPELLLAFFSFLILTFLKVAVTGGDGPMWNWPIIHMLPGLVVRVPRFHDQIFETLAQTGWTFHFRGPLHGNMDALLTSDPANVHYVMSTSFTNFPKGTQFSKMFDFLGNGIFSTDGEPWRKQRSITWALINRSRFKRFLVEATKEKVDNGLHGVLEHAAQNGNILDLQEVFQRFTFDITLKLVTGCDPKSLSLGFPEVPYSKAFDDAEAAMFFRHILPESCWKLMRWLGLGAEGKLSKARDTMDRTAAKYITMKRQELLLTKSSSSADLLTTLMIGAGEEEEEEDDSNQLTMDDDDDKFLKDTIVNLTLAGRDTTSSALTWFFWLLSRNPPVLKKIREELATSKQSTTAGEEEEENKLSYLQGALREALRLYPPVPYEHKWPLTPAVLPSGHRADPAIKVVISLYAMGRMESLWGDDCLEFKPERWISERGGIKHEPSYKFLAFNAGPRTCIGKGIAFTQMKAAAAKIIHGYDFEVVQGQQVSPGSSISLHMKHGLKARVFKRSYC